MQQSYGQSTCPSGCQFSLFSSNLTGEGAPRELLFYAFCENAAERRTAIRIVFPDREKVYAEIQPFLNIMDSVVENIKMRPGRDLPHVRSWTQNPSTGKHKSGESKSFLLSSSCRIFCLLLVFG